MNTFFKYTALLEGISLLILFFIAMPMKYFFKHPELIRPVGMAHGVLFIVYILFATILKYRKSWSWGDYILICLASFVPFGTFFVEKKYLRNA
jgi:integral membrane protein